MNVKLVNIGNSKGICLPKSILTKCNFEEEINLELRGGKVVLSAVKKVRAGWSEAFKLMHQKGDDALAIPDNIVLSNEEWVW